MEENTKPQRIEIIDALRGLSIILMLIHHFLLDLVVLMNAPSWFFSNPLFNVLHYIFAGTFVVLSGVSSRFSHSNIKRGIKVLAVAIAMTVVTSLPVIDEPIRFGILHLLGFCMIFWGLTHKAWDSIPKIIMPFLCIILTVGTAILINKTDIGDAAKYLFMFGWTYPGFYSADWFPILPWFFVFLFGTWAGTYIKAGRLPAWFYEFRAPFLAKAGKHTFLIYILHQPVFYGLLYAIKFIFKI